MRAGVGDKENHGCLPQAPILVGGGKAPPWLFVDHSLPLCQWSPSACRDGDIAGDCPSGVGSKGLGCELQQGTQG